MGCRRCRIRGHDPGGAATLFEADRQELRERALLVGLHLGSRQAQQADLLDELERLAETAGAEVVGRLEQVRRAPDPAFCIGRGKVEELVATTRQRRADLVIFDVELTPTQVRNLERAVQLKVLDRTELILDIFARHARTRAAQAQVELAQLEYAFPRLVRMWTHLSRIEGGIGMRGPGERQIETDRRLISRRIDRLKATLRAVERRRAREVRARSRETTVSLVGYTNAGKSSLLNALTGAHVKVEDALFATLDTRTRRWNLGGHRSVLLSDTVGFIRKLPHQLVASFHATLEEVRQADLLLHVVDVSSPRAQEQARTVDGVLQDLGCRADRCLRVLNKADLLKDEGILPLLRRDAADAVLVSARTGRGLEELTERVAEFVDRSAVRVVVRFDSGNGRLQSLLSTQSTVLSREYEGPQALYRVRIEPARLRWVERLGGVVVSEEDPVSTSSEA